MAPQTTSLKGILNNYHCLSEDVLAAIKNVCVGFSVEKNQAIVVQGEKCDSLYFIRDGLTRVVYSRGEKETTICFGTSGDVFMSFNAMFAGGNSILSWQALSTVNGWKMKITKFRELQVLYPELRTWENKLLEEQLYSFELLFSKMALTTPKERYLQFLTNRPSFLRSLPVNRLTRVLPVKILAQYLGMTPNTLARIRRILIEEEKRKNNQ